MPIHFGTDGWRAVISDTFTFSNLRMVAQAIADAAASEHWDTSSTPNVDPKKFVVGFDTRFLSDRYAADVARVLTANGFSVLLSQSDAPTPAISYAVKYYNAAGGVMITASHNPYEDNGMKIFGPDGYKLTDNLEGLIERHILGQEPEAPPLPPRQIGKAHRIDDARGRYIEFAKHTADNVPLHGLKVVVDCGHGAAYFIAPLIFKELGAEVITAGIQPDGLNINNGCGALYPETAGELVRRFNADLGISFDGDADRVIFTDANGQVVSGDRILALCAIGLKEQGKLRKDTLVTNFMSNLGLREAMRQHGIHVETTAVGDRNVIECMRKNGYSFGGENSGHLIFADHATTGDGILR